MMVLDGAAFYGPPASLSPAARVDTLVNLEAQLSHLHAWQLETLAAMAADPGSGALDREWVREEVRAALGVSAVAAQELLDLASTLSTRLTCTLAALKSGRLTFAMVRYLAEQTCALDDDDALAVEAEALAGDCANATSFRRRVRRLVLAIDTRRAEERRQIALAQRRVVFTPREDGTTELWALLSADGAARLKNRLDAAAAVRDERTADQRRADALCEVPGAPGPAVQVVVPIGALVGASDAPGELDGTPIPASLARELADAPDATWRRLVTDPMGRRVLDCGRARYRPTRALADFVRARDRTCRFPGCHRAATRCELDHVRPWSKGGRTDANNLIPLCLRHHHLKHDRGWRVRRLRDGTVEWTSPTGHVYRRGPDLYPD